MVLFYKGIYPNVRLEKQVIKPTSAPQIPISTETEIISHVKPRIGQGRAGFKRRLLRFSIFQPYDKPKQPKLLPGRKPVIHIVERSILQHPKNIMQSKTRSNISPPEVFIFLGR